MKKPKKVFSSLNHQWFYLYENPLKFLSRGLYEKTHKRFISKPLQLSVHLKDVLRLYGIIKYLIGLI